MKPLRVLLLQTQNPQCQAILRRLADAGAVDLLDTADPRQGVGLVAKLGPELVLLAFDGGGTTMSVIEEIMSRCPVPILLLALPGVGVETSARGVQAGAVDVIPIPAVGNGPVLTALASRLRLVSKVQVIRHVRGRGRLSPAARVVAIAASTGGPKAVAEVLRGLGGLRAPVLVVQHLDPAFTGRFQEWMARESPLPVLIAKHGELARAGSVYVAPSGFHLLLGGGGRLALDPEPATLHRPSADVLFRSVAEQAGVGAGGLLLTGMGDDGAAGLLAILRSGGRTIVQDEGTSVVYGMAKAAYELGAVEEVLALDLIAPAVLAAAAVPA